jgi:hypothetical protein
MPARRGTDPGHMMREVAEPIQEAVCGSGGDRRQPALRDYLG